MLPNPITFPNQKLRRYFHPHSVPLEWMKNRSGFFFLNIHQYSGYSNEVNLNFYNMLNGKT